MNNQEKFSKQYSSKSQIKDWIEEYYNSPEQIKKRNNEQEQERENFKNLCDHIHKVCFLAYQEREIQKEKDRITLEEIKILKEKKEQEFDSLCKTYPIEEPIDIFKFPIEHRPRFGSEFLAIFYNGYF